MYFVILPSASCVQRHAMKRKLVFFKVEALRASSIIFFMAIIINSTFSFSVDIIGSQTVTLVGSDKFLSVPFVADKVQRAE